MVGGRFTGLLEVTVWGEMNNIHLMKSTIQGMNIELTGEVRDRSSHFLVVQAVVVSLQSTTNRSYMQLSMDEESRIFPMPNPTDNSLRKVVEVCAGLGCLGWGMQNAGFQTVLRVDWSKPISELAEQIDSIPSYVANIADDSTLIPLCEIGQDAGTIAAGVSCQPYSRLGDQKQQHDARADTLPKTLRIAHLTRKQIVVLECVEGAMHCKWLQEILHQFCKETGFKIQQGLLHLQQVWPARRTRWWCVLMHPSLGQIQLQSFPPLNPQPTISCLTERFLRIMKDQLDQLELDTYELGKWGVQGLLKNEVNVNKQMATSLHSCANHLIACPCGCRVHPISEGRLQRDGMHGLLIPMNETVKAHDVIYPKMRHIHPDELSLFNGVVPGKPWGKNLRLALCALGQLASPLQSGWIASQLQQHLYSMNLVKDKPPTPVEVLKTMMQDLLEARDVIFGPQTQATAQAFQESIENMAKPVLNGPIIEESKVDEESKEEKTESKGNGVLNFSQEPLDDLDQAILAGKTKDEPTMEKNPNQAEISEALKSSVLNASQQTAEFQNGAVPGFAVKRKQESEDDRDAKHRCISVQQAHGTMQTLACTTVVASPSAGEEAGKEGGPCQSDRWCPNSGSAESLALGDTITTAIEETPVIFDGYEMIPSSPNSDDPSTFAVVEVYIGHPIGALKSLVAPCGTTVGQLLEAETKLHFEGCDYVARDAMGNVIPIHQELQQGQFVMLSEDNGMDEAIFNPPKLVHDKRDILLWQQKGWVAVDEMAFYLQNLSLAKEACCESPALVPDDPMWETLVCQHILKMATASANQSNNVCISAFLNKSHWNPLLIRVCDTDIQVHTTPEVSIHLEQWCKTEFQVEFVFKPIQLRKAFEADCGFQTIQGLTRVLAGEEQWQPMGVQEATELRGSFHGSLEQQNKAEGFVKAPLQLGGMNKDEQSLQKLLQDHGVNPIRSKECAEQVMKALGPQAVRQIMTSPRPWADLKARSSMQQPPIRLVLAEELQQMIQARTQKGGPVGRKNNKHKSTPQESQKRFQLNADQVVVPKAVFAQSDGVELQQISHKDLQPGCKGIVVANIEDALPFFGLKSPVSSEGVGLLILDFTDARIPEHHCIIKVPVLCKMTNEPMLITAALVQIGDKEIKRNTPSTCQAVQEVANQVFRILVFKDQYPCDWNEFCKAPVRQLMNQEPLASINHQIVDVWDRQFLSAKMSKVQPQEAYLFAVSIRVQQCVSEDLAKTSGEEGKYVEPRIATGRQPDPDFRVIWLPRKTFREATLAKQTAPVACTLVRTADRYGLRTSFAQAEELHKIHRPDQMFLHGTELKRFRVGPMPYGANKQSLANVFKTWQWNARPVGPYGQSRSRDGVLWVVQSAESPQSWVYHLAHGDVLITPENPEPHPSAIQPLPVLASNRTIQSLKQPSARPESKQEDPWLHYDPWQNPPAGNSKEASVHQINAVQAKLEAIVDQKIRDHMPDAEMSQVDSKTEAKVNALESQLQALSSSVQSYQQQQANHNQMVQTQMVQLEAQNNSIQQILDHKLDDQMQRIEQLLSKRSRVHE